MRLLHKLTKRRGTWGFPFGTKRSGGIPVSTEVHALISQGNAARDAAKWHSAREAYSKALALAPALHHIHIQLGHVYKRAERIAEAHRAYDEAARLRPGDPEPLLHRAYLAKDGHQISEAAGLFLEVLSRRGDHAEAGRELIALIEPVAAIPIAYLRPALEARSAAIRSQGASSDEPHASGDVRPRVFDVTDLVGHFRYQRLPTGIQRVQIEVLRAAVAAYGESNVGICCCVSGREYWIGIPASVILELARLAGMGGAIDDPIWQAARAKLFLLLALDDPYEMPQRAILINLGTSLWVFDYFRYIRNAKRERNISYIPLVHDLIPIILPRYCIPGITEEFGSWVSGVFQHADGFLAVSRSTGRDLLRAADQLGVSLRSDRIEIVPLDADFSQGRNPASPERLERWGLSDKKFVLLVSTIEPRKNHLLAFDAWSVLLRRHGPSMPQLVCVGRNGWMTEQIYARLANDPALIAGVTIVHDANDEELALLYSKSLFTLYPSHYEGWGLPVTESLCYGRVPVTADNSALSEAGRGLALSFESDSIPALVDAVEHMTFDDRARQALETEITAAFAPRAWSAVADHILGAVSTLAEGGDNGLATQLLHPGRYHSIGLHRSPILWNGLVNGEIFRVGDGWVWPEVWGCYTTGAGGELRFRMSPSDDEEPTARRLYIHVRGLRSADCQVIATIGDGAITGELVLRPGETGWLGCTLPSTAAASLSVVISGSTNETIRLAVAGVERLVEVSVAVLGLMICDGDDETPCSSNRLKISSWQTAP